MCSHGPQLAALPVTMAGPYPTARATVAALARFTRHFEPDRTHHHWGRRLQTKGWRRGLNAADCAEQARCIIPVAAGHLAALYLLFMQATQSTAVAR